MVLSSSTPILSDSFFFRFETEHKLATLSGVLGKLVTVEVRKHRPKHEVIDSLHVNNAINVVAGAQEREEPFKHQTSNKQGIDLIYDGSYHVRIRMRCKKHQHPLVVGDSCPSSILKRTLQRKIPLSADGSAASSDDSSDDDAVEHAVAKVGLEFSKDDSSRRIWSIGLVLGVPPLVAAVAAWPKSIEGKVERSELWRVECWIEAQQEDEQLKTSDDKC